MKFLVTLSTSKVEDFTKEDFDKVATYITSDGCTGVTDFYRETCIEHDFYFATRRDFEGNPISFAETNARFRKAIQRKSKLRWFSPMSYWRWLAVSILGRPMWFNKD